MTQRKGILLKYVDDYKLNSKCNKTMRKMCFDFTKHNLNFN